MRTMVILALALSLTAPARALTTTQQVAKLRAAVDEFTPMVQQCGPKLLRHYGKPNVHRALTFAVSEIPNGKTVAGVPLNGTQIVLFPRFFEQEPREAARYLVHEWLHTQGVTHEEAGGTQGINKTVWEACK